MQLYFVCVCSKCKFKCNVYLIVWASQMVLVVKNPLNSVGDIREVSSIPRW